MVEVTLIGDGAMFFGEGDGIVGGVVVDNDGLVGEGNRCDGGRDVVGFIVGENDARKHGYDLIRVK